MPIFSTDWSTTSTNSTDWTNTTVNSTNWEDDDPSAGYILLQSGDDVLTQDGSILLLQ